jgi:C1A family cysteine protease
MNRKYGWRPDKPDHRDHRFAITGPAPEALPQKVDLRPHMPSVYDQGELGSCTGNAIAGAVEYLWMKSGRVVVPSRLFIYYGERVIEGTVRQDAGAEIRDGIKVISTKGACLEPTWPYVISKFARKPTAKAFSEGLKHRASSYARVDNSKSTHVMGALAAGFPVVFGFTVYDSFESDEVARTGRVPMPSKSEKALGGHAVLAVGYDAAQRVFIVRNSWGAGWGDHGYFYMPFEYACSTDLADDFWVVKVTA